MSSLLTNLAANGRRTDILERVEAPAAALTLTRAATLAIVTTGTTITWQSEVRNRGFNWSGTDITIPTGGFYVMQVSYATTGTVTMSTQITVNGTRLGYIGFQQVATNFFQSTFLRYFATGDVIQISAFPSVNTTISVNAEGAINYSPFISITQITGAV